MSALNMASVHPIHSVCDLYGIEPNGLSISIGSPIDVAFFRPDLFALSLLFYVLVSVDGEISLL